MHVARISEWWYGMVGTLVTVAVTVLAGGTATQTTFTAPAVPPGTYEVTVQTAAGRNAALSLAYRPFPQDRRGLRNLVDKRHEQHPPCRSTRAVTQGHCEESQAMQ